MAKLGLNKHIVRLSEHQEEWPQIFLETKEELQALLGDLPVAIEHVGSTSVPGLAAKPIIDVAIGIKDAEILPELISRLEAGGYEYRGDAGENGGHLLVRSVALDVRTHHIHVVGIGDPQWDNYIRFRDKLREDPELVRRYAELKCALAKKFANDRPAYTAAKDAFISEILGR